MMKKILIALSALFAAVTFQSCLESDVEDYSDWRAQNDLYLDTLDTSAYTKVSPDWAPYHYIYMKWHNDRALTRDSLMPLSTSNVSVKYELCNIDSTFTQTSYKSNGDSLYTAVVNNNIIGFQIGLLNMHVGDSVTMIIPYNSGYGSQSTSMRPYSNLIYRVKMVKILDWEKPAE